MTIVLKPNHNSIRNSMLITISSLICHCLIGFPRDLIEETKINECTFPDNNEGYNWYTRDVDFGWRVVTYCQCFGMDYNFNFKLNSLSWDLMPMHWSLPNRPDNLIVRTKFKTKNIHILYIMRTWREHHNHTGFSNVEYIISIVYQQFQ